MSAGCGLRLWFVLIMLLCSPWSVAERLPAVMLRHTPLLTPVETAGTGVAPTIDVRVTVDERGQVAAVAVSSVSPSSDYDQFFVDAVQDSIAGWRFAPALDSGQPVASELSWSLQFRPAEASLDANGGAPPSHSVGEGAGVVERLSLRGLLSDAPTGRLRQLQIFTLPVEQQRAHLERLVEKAEAQIDQSRRQTAAGDGFAVVTDHHGEGTAEIVHGNAMAVFTMVADALGGNVPFASNGVPVVIYLYWTEAQYRAFVESVDGIQETTGIFCAPGLIALHSERSSNEVLLSTLVHEAVHAFIYRHVVTPGRQLPRWLDEGFADYFGNSKIGKKGLVPGERRVTQFYTSLAGIWRGRTEAQLDIDAVKRKIRRGEALRVPDILNASRETFYGDIMSQYYAQSWILVHMLRHGEAAWKAQHFPEMLLLVAEGYPVPQVVEKVYGFSPESLEQRYRNYARSF